ncbi:MAG: galactose-1-phosphate uridylyltransferase [bacterium]|nr:galactose-1-phosphate uridylyltransferase [bacterium]
MKKTSNDPRGEIRQDPVSNNYIILSEERAQRPFYYEFQNKLIENNVCPFCSGNEEMTPPAVLTVDDENNSGWKIRVVPNKYPALEISGSLDFDNAGLEYGLSGEGVHEVVIETPRHESSLTGLTEAEAADVIKVYSRRLRDLSKNKNSACGMIFKNTGPVAGTSVVHTHTQILALPVIPPAIADEIYNSQVYYVKHGNCIFCDILENEMESCSRIIEQNDSFAAFCPYASRFPYEIWIAPLKHNSHFEAMQDNEYNELSAILHKTLYRLEMQFIDCSYNYYIHTMPFRSRNSSSYHWHIEIIPRTSFIGGFELGTGMYINQVFPETAAEVLKEVVKDQR